MRNFLNFVAFFENKGGAVGYGTALAPSLVLPRGGGEGDLLSFPRLGEGQDGGTRTARSWPKFHALRASVSS